MKRKIAIILSVFLFVASLVAQNPVTGFPYYYYDSSEKSFSDYAYYFYYNFVEIENNDEHVIKMAKENNTYYIWTEYKIGKKASESDIKHTLKAYKDVASDLDNRLDSKQGYNTNVCFIFTDYKENLICSAQYSPQY